jgi:hypothetical protein
MIAAYKWRRRGCGVGKETICILPPHFYIHFTNNRLPGLSLLTITAFGQALFGPRAFRGPGRLFLKACTSPGLPTTAAGVITRPRRLVTPLLQQSQSLQFARRALR